MSENHTNIGIRPVRIEDAEAIWRISRQPGVMDTIIHLPSTRLEQRITALQELTPDDHYFVAEIGAQVVGLAGLTVGQGRTRHSGSLFVFVAQESQGKGAGTALLHALLDLSDNWLLLHRVELTVLTENEKAKQLYEQLGFVVEGLRKMSIIAHGELKDEWLMARYH